MYVFIVLEAYACTHATDRSRGGTRNRNLAFHTRKSLQSRTCMHHTTCVRFFVGVLASVFVTAHHAISHHISVDFSVLISKHATASSLLRPRSLTCAIWLLISQPCALACDRSCYHSCELLHGRKHSHTQRLRLP